AGVPDHLDPAPESVELQLSARLRPGLTDDAGQDHGERHDKEYEEDEHAQPDPSGHLRTRHPARLGHPQTAPRQADPAPATGMGSRRSTGACADRAGRPLRRAGEGTRLAPLPTEFLIDDLTWSLLIGSTVLLVAVAAVRISVRSGLPALLIFLALGLLLGESGLGIRFDSEELTQVLGYAALVLILAEGGLTTRWTSI